MSQLPGGQGHSNHAGSFVNLEVHAGELTSPDHPVPQVVAVERDLLGGRIDDLFDSIAEEFVLRQDVAVDQGNAERPLRVQDRLS